MSDNKEKEGEASIFQALTNFITSTVSSITWTPDQEGKVQEKIEELYDLQVKIHNKAQEIREIITPQKEVPQDEPDPVEHAETENGGTADESAESENND